MSEAVPPAGEAPASTSPPASPGAPRTALPCSACGAPVDPLRAPAVAHLGERFRYFCSTECRSRFASRPTLTPLPLPREARREPLAAEVAFRQRGALAEVASDGLAELSSAAVPPSRREGAPVVAPLEGSDLDALLLGLGGMGGLLALGLGVLGDGGLVATSRVLVLLVATGALVAEGTTGRRDPTELHPVARLAAPAGATLLGIVARLGGSPHQDALATLAAVLVITTALASHLVGRARRARVAARATLQAAFEVPARRVQGEEVTEVAAGELRPGEEILLEAGEILPVDATVSAGSAVVAPWPGATARETRREGEPMAAGARVEAGTLRLVVGWTGLDRAWLRCVVDPGRRADVHASLSRRGLYLAERGAPVAAAAGALAAYATGADLPWILAAACAAQGALATPAIAEVAAQHASQVLHEGLTRGIAWRSARAFDQSTQVTTVVFSARGTLLVGEPEVTSVEAASPAISADLVLALAAGACGASATPASLAVVRAARARGVRADGVRSPTEHAGLGITAVASSGEALAVGGRALMLRELVSIARAEPRLAEIEALGRSVLLVAVGGKLQGWLALQDGLRAGARAAVQQVLDAGIEPVLLTGEARETSEAIARALDIEHVRPEVLPAERGLTVQRLRDGGATTAAVGRSGVDDLALGAADVSIGLGSAGSSAAEWDIQLASDDVREAAHALHLATRFRRQASLGLSLAAAPGALGVLTTAFAVAPPVAAPVLGLLGAVAALLHLRTTEEGPAGALDPRTGGRDTEASEGTAPLPAVRAPDRARLLEALHAYMARRGLRSTGQRRVIVETFFNQQDHVTIDQLLKLVRAVDPRIGYATVYRTMKMLAEGGIVHERKFGDGFTRYELADDDAHHDHLICLGCGAITEFEEPLIEELQARIASRYDFEITDHKHELYGYCASCREQRATRKGRSTPR